LEVIRFCISLGCFRFLAQQGRKSSVSIHQAHIYFHFRKICRLSGFAIFITFSGYQVFQVDRFCRLSGFAIHQVFQVIRIFNFTFFRLSGFPDSSGFHVVRSIRMSGFANYQVFQVVRILSGYRNSHIFHIRLFRFSVTYQVLDS
jgi:hypothetical protein